MAFRLPQVPNQSEQVRRFVASALQARAQSQAEDFQMRKDLVNIDSQIKRKDMLNSSYANSVANLRKSYEKDSGEFNRDVENEATQYDLSAPEAAASLRRSKRPEPKLVTRTFLDDQGRKAERLERFDEFKGTSTPVVGSERVIDENTKVITAETDNGGKTEKKAVTVGPKGNVVKSETIGTTESDAAKEARKEAAKQPEERTSYRIALERKNRASDAAENAGRRLDDVEAQIEVNKDAGEIFYENKSYKIGPATDQLKKKILDEVNQAKKQETEYQTQIEKIKGSQPVKDTSDTKGGTAGVIKKFQPTAGTRYWDPTTNSIVDTLKSMKK